MFDARGKTCFVRSNLESGNHKFPIDNFPNGMHFLQITSEKGKTVHKVLIKK